MKVEHVLVTGSAGAIGGALARHLRARFPALRLTLVDRVASAREADAPGVTGAPDAHVVADLSDLAALPELVRDAEARHGPIDGLCNVAGFMEVRRFDSFAWEQVAALVQVDMLSPLRLMHLVTRGLLARGARGFVVNVASMAARVPIKGCAGYGAAKAGLAMASEIAHAELAPHGIDVVTVYPGPVTSELEKKARGEFAANTSRASASRSSRTNTQGESVLARALPTGDPDILARRILGALARHEARVIYPAAYHLGWAAPDLAARFALGFGPEPA